MYNTGIQLYPHPVARIAKLTACVPFFPEFESVCNRSFCIANQENIGGSLPSNPAARTGYLVHVRTQVPSNGKPSRSLEHLFSVSTDLWLPDTPVPTGRLSLHLLYYGILIRFRFSMWVNLSLGGQCGRVLLERSQIFPIDSGESPLFSSPLNFLGPR